MKTWLRCGAAVAGMACLAFPTTAAADPGQAVPSADRGYVLHGTNDSSHRADVITVSLGQDDSKAVLGYSLAVDPRLDTDAGYTDDDSFDTDGMGEVRWVLQHGYPGADAGKLADLAGANLAGKTDAGTVAYAATQAAIWSVTDDFTLDRSNPTGAGALVDAAVLAIADYLQDHAKPTDPRENNVTLEGPDSGKADGSIGPYTASGPNSEGKLWVSAKAGSTVNADGDKIDEVAAGDEFFVVPTAGASKVEVTAQAADAPPPGQVLTANDAPALVLAEYGSGGASSDISVDITGKADGSVLPVTGSPLTAVVATGTGLALAGVALLVFARGQKPPRTDSPL